VPDKKTYEICSILASLPPNSRASDWFMRKLLILIVSGWFGIACCAEVPETRRSKKAIERVTSTLVSALAEKDMRLGAPVFIQITKQPAELNVFVKGNDETFQLFRTYKICAYSGGLGPKKKQGDAKSPEGFYSVRPNQMNPTSSYHLSFNLGYPNAFDRAKGYTGDYLMVHGDCVSIGCYAMTDPVMDEIWTLMAAAFEGGQSEIGVHIFPFRMNWPLRAVLPNHPDRPFWSEIAPGWTAFAKTSIPPKITVASEQYVISPTEQ